MTNAWDTSSGDSVIFDQPLYKGEIKSNSFSVTHENKNILTITSDGNLILGESFTKDEAAKEFAKILLKIWKKKFKNMDNHIDKPVDLRFSGGSNT